MGVQARDRAPVRTPRHKLKSAVSLVRAAVRMQKIQGYWPSKLLFELSRRLSISVLARFNPSPSFLVRRDRAPVRTPRHKLKSAVSLVRAAVRMQKMSSDWMHAHLGNHAEVGIVAVGNLLAMLQIILDGNGGTNKLPTATMPTSA
jgi:hypothetical protein